MYGGRQMKVVGVVRNVDQLGRVVVPKSMRKRFDINEGNPVEIVGTDEGVLIRKYQADTKSELEKFVDSLSEDKLEELKNLVNGYFN